jgi:hypothetical protein
MHAERYDASALFFGSNTTCGSRPPRSSDCIVIVSPTMAS